MREPTSMDIAICGPLRSDTTLLCDLLTVKGKALVISEPDLHVEWHGHTVNRLHKLFQDVKLNVAPEPPSCGKVRRRYIDWFGENIVPQLAGLDLWGVKQVDFFAGMYFSNVSRHVGW
ncbi:MAG: hypothetical protein P8Q36_11615 [Alphaproteobacteria bacterium]|jgi:hypothetical protein|nr:hypothetical protein [Rhodospirillaceae bacterium]MBT6513103.1 hypothetical protein [Rhodospirillaceae bacterium]MBT7612048.1 hypothetical protein [Rhodospirillaceae bacterium]MBT7645911.1 hypothetical protein [Rhodospirillaceae bacterium]MDG2481497.1 hypothetical protein [Alphaproteobacteria bacterium]